MGLVHVGRVQYHYIDDQLKERDYIHTCAEETTAASAVRLTPNPIKQRKARSSISSQGRRRRSPIESDLTCSTGISHVVGPFPIHTAVRCQIEGFQGENFEKFQIRTRLETRKIQES
jgi:hypothetical protein